MLAHLNKRVKISQAITVTNGAAGTSTINGATLDMSGWEGVLVILQFGAIVTNAVTSVKMQQGQQSGAGDMADLLGTGQTVADSDDEKTFYIDVYRPAERYVRVVVPRATQNATVTAIYIQYGPRTQPTTHQATVIVGETHTSPAEGTA